MIKTVNTFCWPLFKYILIPFNRYVNSVSNRSFSSPYFPAFVLNTKRYSVSLRVHSECGKTRTRKTPNTDTFHAVNVFDFIHDWKNIQTINKRKTQDNYIITQKQFNVIWILYYSSWIFFYFVTKGINWLHWSYSSFFFFAILLWNFFSKIVTLRIHWRTFPRRIFPQRTVPRRHFLDGQFPEGQFPEGHCRERTVLRKKISPTDSSPKTFPRRTVPRRADFRRTFPQTDNSPKGNFANGQFPEWHFPE